MMAHSVLEKRKVEKFLSSLEELEKFVRQRSSRGVYVRLEGGELVFVSSAGSRGITGNQGKKVEALIVKRQHSKEIIIFTLTLPQSLCLDELINLFCL